jgi:hypothetical protein
MVDSMVLRIGAVAVCIDTPCRRVSRIVTDPLDQVVTHLVVEPEHRQGSDDLSL